MFYDLVVRYKVLRFSIVRIFNSLRGEAEAEFYSGEYFRVCLCWNLILTSWQRESGFGEMGHGTDFFSLVRIVL